MQTLVNLLLDTSLHHSHQLAMCTQHDYLGLGVLGEAQEALLVGYIVMKGQHSLHGVHDLLVQIKLNVADDIGAKAVDDARSDDHTCIGARAGVGFLVRHSDGSLLSK